jgi:tripartite-type tricarboxylate transporter receptor subunit TctC
MVTDLLGGQVDVMFDNFPNAMPHVKAGKMRALGITSAKRVASAPNIPTIAEQGYPGFDVSVWYGIFAPANVPAPILQKLNSELNKALKSDDVKDNFAAAGVFILGGSIDDFEKFNKAQDVKWSSVISKSGIKAE